MFSVSENGIVTVNRGDSFELPITLNIGSSMNYEEYYLQPCDTIYLGIMEPNQPFETAIVRKKFTSSDMTDGVVKFCCCPEDTVCLIPGKYYYQVKIATVDSKTKRTNVKTLVDKTLFYIQEWCII